MSIERIMVDIGVDHTCAEAVMQALRGEAPYLPEPMRQRLAEIAASRQWATPKELHNGPCAYGASMRGAK